MSWYYAENNERRGPIEDTAFDGLIAAGTVRPETLVWREGMANWQSLAASGYQRSSAPAPSGMPPVPDYSGGQESARPPAVEMGVCSESGRILPRSELVEIDGRLVSVEYKNVVLQRIREGVGSTGSSIDPEVLAQQIISRDYQLSAGSCLGRGWDLLRKNLGLCVGAAFLNSMVMSASAFTIIGIFFVFGPLTAGLYWMILRMLRKQPASVGDAFVGFSRNYWQLVVVGLITLGGMIACFLPGLICFGASFIASSGSSGGAPNPSVPLMVIAGILFFAGYAAMIYLAVCWIFSFLLAIDKQIEAWPAMRLSRRIVSMHWWRVFWVMFLTGLVIFGIMIGVMLVCGLLIALFALATSHGGQVNPAIPIILGGITQLVYWALILCLTPLIYTTTVVMYEDIFGTRTPHQ